MAETRYIGLAEFGLPLIAKGDPSFDALVAEIESHPGPGPAQPALTSDRAAVLLNNTGKAIIALQWFWRYTYRDGKKQTSSFSNFGSSAQRDVLIGRSKVGRDFGTFILPGSKRLITENGFLGNNLDVLTPEELPRTGGYCCGWGGGSPRERAETELAAVELILDLAILEDGLCVGPDESGLYKALNESLDLQSAAAQKAVEALESGASVGQVFEIVRPLARHGAQVPLLLAFSGEAIHHLTNASDADLLAFFKRAAAPRSLELHRPRASRTT